MHKHSQLALNHITCPFLDLGNCILLAQQLGISKIEIRNDLSERPMTDYLPNQKILEWIKQKDVEIISINALQQFNRGSRLEEKVEELQQIVKVASSCGCQGIVLCPVCSADDHRSNELRLADTVAALQAYGRLFQDTGILGLVEPLGFEVSSLRYKKDAVKAIMDSGYPQVYKIVHDTFHHYLSGETDILVEHTALVHVSGVAEDLPKTRLTDDQRILVTDDDIMGNRLQVRRFKDSGYKGPFSYEVFSKDVQAMAEEELAGALTSSMRYLFS